MRSALLAILGVVLLVAGVSLLSVPAGLIAAGVAAVTAAYVVRYLEVKQNENA